MVFVVRERVFGWRVFFVVRERVFGWRVFFVIFSTNDRQTVPLRNGKNSRGSSPLSLNASRRTTAISPTTMIVSIKVDIFQARVLFRASPVSVNKCWPTSSGAILLSSGHEFLKGSIPYNTSTMKSATLRQLSSARLLAADPSLSKHWAFAQTTRHSLNLFMRCENMLMGGVTSQASVTQKVRQVLSTRMEMAKMISCSRKHAAMKLLRTELRFEITTSYQNASERSEDN